MSWLDRFLGWFRMSPVMHPSQLGPVEAFDADDIVRRHNSERIAHGLKPVTLLRVLCTRAEQRAAHAADARLTAEHLHDGFTAVLGARETGENAAMGQADAVSAMASWMASLGHRDNILDPAFTAMGAGRAVSAEGVTYWFAIFAGWSD